MSRLSYQIGMRLKAAAAPVGHQMSPGRPGAHARRGESLLDQIVPDRPVPGQAPNWNRQVQVMPAQPSRSDVQ